METTRPVSRPLVSITRNEASGETNRARSARHCLEFATQLCRKFATAKCSCNSLAAQSKGYTRWMQIRPSPVRSRICGLDDDIVAFDETNQCRLLIRASTTDTGTLRHVRNLSGRPTPTRRCREHPPCDVILHQVHQLWTSGWISIRHPVRRAARRAFCPSLPMANDS